MLAETEVIMQTYWLESTQPFYGNSVQSKCGWLEGCKTATHRPSFFVHELGLLHFALRSK